MELAGSPLTSSLQHELLEWRACRLQQANFLLVLASEAAARLASEWAAQEEIDMEMLKSSLKTLQEAIAAMKPIGPICLQDAETQSFRSLAAEVNCPFSTSTTATCSSSGSSSPISLPFGAVIPNKGEYSTAAAMPGASSLNDLLLVRGPISSERFFFSPRTTNSIMEESKSPPPPQQQPELCKGASEQHSSSLYEESVMLAMSSNDPFHDFRASMEEMVAAHQLREWRNLQELLNCYLRLNDRENHKVIVLAFVDLLMHLMNQDQQVL